MESICVVYFLFLAWKRKREEKKSYIKTNLSKRHKTLFFLLFSSSVISFSISFKTRHCRLRPSPARYWPKRNKVVPLFLLLLSLIFCFREWVTLRRVERTNFQIRFFRVEPSRCWRIHIEKRVSKQVELPPRLFMELSDSWDIPYRNQGIGTLIWVPYSADHQSTLFETCCLINGHSNVKKERSRRKSLLFSQGDVMFRGIAHCVFHIYL